MKAITLFLSLLLVISTAKGQVTTDLKGPKNKNYKHFWKKDKESGAYTKASVVVVKGPKAKNSKVGMRSNEISLVPIKNKPKTTLKGPRYKNKKPWKN